MLCAKFEAQKQSEASKLLQQLEAVGSIDPQAALLLLRQCGSTRIGGHPQSPREWKRGRERVRESKRLLKILFENIPLGYQQIEQCS